jgi:hypothetical protein
VEDLLAIVDGIGAERIIPVHTEDPRPFKKASGGQVVVPRVGAPISL